MGIVNLTDNSYFASSRCLGPSGEVDIGKALDRTEQMLAEGADIIDIGACSTRPGSQGVGAKEEWRRLGPFLREAQARAFPAGGAQGLRGRCPHIGRYLLGFGRGTLLRHGRPVHGQ